jgi:hypothetical protein
MQQVKKTEDFTIFQKRSGRYAVQGKDKKWINGDNKTRILLDAALIKPPLTKAPEPESLAESEGAEGAADQAES